MTGDVTTLLHRWRDGDNAALDQLVPLVYDELRRVARARLRNEPVDHPLQTTALVHEAYIRLVSLDRMTLADRTHFFAMAARLMRQVLVDQARRIRADKRGGGLSIVALDAAVGVAGASPNVDLIALDRALDELEALDPRLCRVVELRFFSGLSIDEAAAALHISTATVERDWAFTKAWLHQRLS
jgi:RNA polymerase sigma factor (TIGR02999 family)